MAVGAADDEEDDSEGDDFGADEEDAALTPCPRCGKRIYEEAQKCEFCGAYVSEEQPGRRHPWWFYVGALICLYTVYLWIRS